MHMHHTQTHTSYQNAHKANFDGTKHELPKSLDVEGGRG
jgi:hypothetical protein